MRYIWTNAGDDPDLNVGDRHGITGYFMPLDDPVTTTTELMMIRARGKAVGVYVGHGWYGALTPKQAATKASAGFRALAVPGLRFQWNLEEHDPTRIIQILQEWRRIHPNVGTSWTLEGMQGGWMDAAFVTEIIQLKVRVVPQCFQGNMTTVAQDIVLRDLLRRGFPEALVTCMYDAANLPAEWDGYAFNMGRLP